MLSANKKIWFFSLSLLYIILTSIFVMKDRVEIFMLPVFILIAFLAIFKMDVLVKIIIFFVPLSVTILDLNISSSIDMSLPTEPMLFGLMLIFIIRLFMDGGFEKKILAHPITIAILINLLWITITTTTSIRPLISFKFLISRIWFLATFYFIMTQLLKDKKNILQFFWLYIAGFSFVLVYTIYMHSTYEFDQKSANWVMDPFFNDHTSYGACIAFLSPFLISKLFDKEIVGTKKFLLNLLFILFLIALVLSYTRAAWLSIVAALVVYLMLRYRVKWWIISLATLFTFVFIFLMWSKIMVSIENNKQDSSNDLKQHVSSISNVSSDASNLERINRWKSAIAMFEQRPLFGWGPGTYAFEYAPFQSSYDKTIISTNSGDGGNAHSEYLGPLSESGLIGFLSMLLIVITTLITGIKIYKKQLDPKLKSLGLITLLGLITYYLHGILNNFLDTDKVSCLFWGLTAIIVVLDVHYLPKKTEDMDRTSSTN